MRIISKFLYIILLCVIFTSSRLHATDSLEQLRKFMNVPEGITGQGVTVGLVEFGCCEAELRLPNIVYKSEHFNPFPNFVRINEQELQRKLQIYWLNDFTLENFRQQLMATSPSPLTQDKIEKVWDICTNQQTENDDCQYISYFDTEIFPSLAYTSPMVFLKHKGDFSQDQKSNIEKEARRNILKEIEASLNHEKQRFSIHGSLVLRELLRFTPDIKVKFYSPLDLQHLAQDPDVQIVTVQSKCFYDDKTFSDQFEPFENTGKLIVFACPNQHIPLRTSSIYYFYQWAQQAQGCSFLFASASSMIRNNILGSVSLYLTHDDSEDLKTLYINAPGFALLHIEPHKSDFRYNVWEGSSFAAPYAAAAAALLQSRFPHVSPTALGSILIESGRKPMQVTQKNELTST